jgi:hypothetical protein
VNPDSRYTQIWIQCHPRGCSRILTLSSSGEATVIERVAAVVVGRTWTVPKLYEFPSPPSIAAMGIIRSRVGAERDFPLPDALLICLLIYQHLPLAMSLPIRPLLLSMRSSSCSLCSSTGMDWRAVALLDYIRGGCRVERGKGNQNERSASEGSVEEMDKVRIGYVDTSLGYSM